MKLFPKPQFAIGDKVYSRSGFVVEPKRGARRVWSGVIMSVRRGWFSVVYSVAWLEGVCEYDKPYALSTVHFEDQLMSAIEHEARREAE